MAIRELSQSDTIEAIMELQRAVLVGLGQETEWRKDEVVHHGGTSLLLHQSPRFSEDIDFIANFQKVTVESIQNTLEDTVLPKITQLGLKSIPDPEQFKLTLKVKDKETNSNKAFWITLDHPNFHRNLRLKLEFFMTKPERVKAYISQIKTLRYNTKTLLTLQGDIPVATLQSIYVDKACVLPQREAIKYRDVYDLNFVINQGGVPDPKKIKDMVENNSLIHERTTEGMIKKMSKFLEERPLSAEDYEADMATWLDPDIVQSMKEQSLFKTGIDVVYGAVHDVRDILVNGPEVAVTPTSYDFDAR